MELVVNVLARWAHVGAAIVVLGGSCFLRFVVMPAAAKLPEAEHEAFRTAVMGRWKRFVHVGIGLFLLSGFYNYVRALPLHKGDGAYHALLGIKMLLAFAVFILASGLVGRSRVFAPLRAKASKWLLITVILAGAVVAISGYVRVALPPQSPGLESAAPQNETSARTTLGRSRHTA